MQSTLKRKVYLWKRWMQSLAKVRAFRSSSLSCLRISLTLPFLCLQRNESAKKTSRKKLTNDPSFFTGGYHRTILSQIARMVRSGRKGDAAVMPCLDGSIALLGGMKEMSIEQSRLRRVELGRFALSDGGELGSCRHQTMMLLQWPSGSCMVPPPTTLQLHCIDSV